MWNNFEIYNITLPSQGCSPYSTSSGVSTMQCRITMETTVLFNRRLNYCFFMLKVAIASNVIAWRILQSCIQTDFSSSTDIWSMLSLCHLNKCYSKWTVQNESMIWTFRKIDLIIKAIIFQGKAGKRIFHIRKIYRSTLICKTLQWMTLIIELRKYWTKLMTSRAGIHSVVPSVQLLLHGVNQQQQMLWVGFNIRLLQSRNL